MPLLHSMRAQSSTVGSPSGSGSGRKRSRSTPEPRISDGAIGRHDAAADEQIEVGAVLHDGAAVPDTRRHPAARSASRRCSSGASQRRLVNTRAETRQRVDDARHARGARRQRTIDDRVGGEMVDEGRTHLPIDVVQTRQRARVRRDGADAAARLRTADARCPVRSGSAQRGPGGVRAMTRQPAAAMRRSSGRQNIASTLAVLAT